MVAGSSAWVGIAQLGRRASSITSRRLSTRPRWPSLSGFTTDRIGALIASVTGRSDSPLSMSRDTGLVYIPTNQVAAAYLAAQGWKESDIGFQVGLDNGKTAVPADAAARAAAKAATTGALLSLSTTVITRP